MKSQFHKNRQNARVAGVCAGIADHFGFNLFWTRFTFVACTLLGIGFPVLLYILIALLAPAR